MMDQNGATDLVIDLVMEDPSPSVFHESIQLAIALLEGGNGSVQVSSNICLVVMHIPNIALPLWCRFFSILFKENTFFGFNWPKTIELQDLGKAPQSFPWK